MIRIELPHGASFDPRRPLVAVVVTDAGELPVLIAPRNRDAKPENARPGLRKCR